MKDSIILISYTLNELQPFQGVLNVTRRIKISQGILMLTYLCCSNEDAKRAGFLSLKLLLVPMDLLPTDWPRTEKEISMWTGSLKLTMLDNQYERTTTIEAINDVSVTFTSCEI